LSKELNIKHHSLLLRLMMLALLSVAMLGIHTTGAIAMDLQSAKAAGKVGEQPDGYLGMVASAPGV